MLACLRDREAWGIGVLSSVNQSLCNGVNLGLSVLCSGRENTELGLCMNSPEAELPMQVDSSQNIPPKSSILHEESHQARPPIPAVFAILRFQH